MSEKNIEKRAKALLAGFFLLLVLLFSFICFSKAGVPEYVRGELTYEKEKEIAGENSRMTEYISLSPHGEFPRKDRITKITIHHMGGDLTLEQVGNAYRRKNRKISSNYAIDSNGRVGLYVEEKNRSYAKDSNENDEQAVTIEVAGERDGDSAISRKAFKALTELCADICYRNEITELTFTGNEEGTLTYHYMFNDETGCPGKYLKSNTDRLVKTVNRQLKELRGERK